MFFRPVVPMLAITLLLYLIYTLYRHVYQEKLVDSIERNVGKLYRNDGDETLDGSSVGDDGGSVFMRERAKLIRDGLAADIDSLPSVTFLTGREINITQEEREDDKVRILQQHCLTTGVYLSSFDEYVDCRTYCHVSDGVIYQYFARADKLLNTGRIARSGSYCLPLLAALCNENTSLLVYGKTGWRCIPQTRAFAGEGGNRIVACNGTLLDRATGKLWLDFIDPTLRFVDVDEPLTDGRGYRFVCPSGAVDHNGNERVISPYDRLQLLDNYCTSLIPYAATGLKPDFERNACSCENNEKGFIYFEDPTTKACIPFASQDFNERSLETTYRSQQCVEMWSRKSFYRSLITDAKERLSLIPCGIEHKNEAPIGSMPAIVRERGLIFNRPVPSPAAMLSSSSIEKLV